MAKLILIFVTFFVSVCKDTTEARGPKHHNLKNKEAAEAIRKNGTPYPQTLPSSRSPKDPHIRPPSGHEYLHFYSVIEKKDAHVDKSSRVKTSASSSQFRRADTAKRSPHGIPLSLAMAMKDDPKGEDNEEDAEEDEENLLFKNKNESFYVKIKKIFKLR